MDDRIQRLYDLAKHNDETSRQLFRKAQDIASKYRDLEAMKVLQEIANKYEVVKF